MKQRKKFKCAAFLSVMALVFTGCKSDADTAKKSDAAQPPFMSAVAANPPQIPVDALPPDKTGGFDGKAAYEHVAKMVAFGPRPSGSQALAQTQDYILAQLQSFGCTVETDAFNANTPAGPIAMKNVLVK